MPMVKASSNKFGLCFNFQWCGSKRAAFFQYCEDCFLDAICSIVLRSFAHHSCVLLSWVFSNILTECCAPEDWMSAYITSVLFLFFKDDRWQSRNSRPVSLTREVQLRRRYNRNFLIWSGLLFVQIRSIMCNYCICKEWQSNVTFLFNWNMKLDIVLLKVTSNPDRLTSILNCL